MCIMVMIYCADVVPKNVYICRQVPRNAAIRQEATVDQ